MKWWTILVALVAVAGTSRADTFCSSSYGSLTFCASDHCCKRGPQIVLVLPQNACKVIGTTVSGLLRDGGDKYYWRDPGPPCDASLTYERQAWSDWPECEGARQLK